MRCPRCNKALEPGTKICTNCRKPVILSESDGETDRLKPRSKVSLDGVGSRMSGTYHVRATRHKITDSDEFATSQKFRCMKCGTVNEKSDQYCRKCHSRIVH